MTRGRLVVGNWKMNPRTVDAAVALARAIGTVPHPRVEIGVAPSAIALAAVATAVRDSGVAVYAQDVHWEEAGAYTGQLSAGMLVGLASGALVGHSEIRRDQGDDDARVARKLARVIDAGLQAILCVGETEAQFAAAETDAVLRHQIERDLADSRKVTPERFVVAYEPVWAIGTGRPATAAHAARAARTIRTALGARGISADDIRVLYGGSVAPSTVAEFASADGIDGALVGGASLKADEFGAIVRAFGA